jgi:hypothetical protein
VTLHGSRPILLGALALVDLSEVGGELRLHEARPIDDHAAVAVRNNIVRSKKRRHRRRRPRLTASLAVDWFMIMSRCLGHCGAYRWG